LTAALTSLALSTAAVSASDPAGASFADGGLASGLTLMVVGMAVVFGVLSAALLVVVLLNRVLSEDFGRARDAARAPTPVAAPIPAIGDEPTPELAAVVAAATIAAQRYRSGAMPPDLVAALAAVATAAVDRPVRIRRITRVGPSTGGAWTAGGRSSLMGSHRPRRKR